MTSVQVEIMFKILISERMSRRGKKLQTIEKRNHAIGVLELDGRHRSKKKYEKYVSLSSNRSNKEIKQYLYKFVIKK